MSTLARCGSATVYEASDRSGLVDAEFRPLIRGASVAGRARTVRCGQDDNLMVHVAMTRLRPGEILVVSMPEPRPVALVGDMLATQASARGAAGMLVDAAVRDGDAIAEIGVPVWARWVRISGPSRRTVGELDVPVTVGGQQIATGDVVVLDSDGVVVIPADALSRVVDAAHERHARELTRRARLAAGELSYEIDGLAKLFVTTTEGRS